MCGCANQQRVAVRRRFRDDLRPDHGARTGPVVDDDLLPPRFGELLTDEARNYVGAAARSERRDEPDWFRRIRCSCLCVRGGDHRYALQSELGDADALSMIHCLFSSVIIVILVENTMNERSPSLSAGSMTA